MPTIPAAGTGTPKTLGSAATAGATGTTTYSKSDHAHGYDHTTLYGVMGGCSSSDTTYTWTNTEADHRYCFCWKYKLSGAGVSSPRFNYQSGNLSAAECRSECAYNCATNSGWREYSSW
jgi:hypothetical protein